MNPPSSRCSSSACSEPFSSMPTTAMWISLSLKTYNLSSVSKSALCCTFPGNIPPLLLTITAPSMLAPINHLGQEKTNTKLLTGKSGVRPPSALHHWQTWLICLQQKTFHVNLAAHVLVKTIYFLKASPKGSQVELLCTAVEHNEPRYKLDRSFYSHGYKPYKATVLNWVRIKFKSGPLLNDFCWIRDLNLLGKYVLARWHSFVQ